MPKQQWGGQHVFDANLADCEIGEASISAAAEGGVTYRVICRSVPDEMLTGLTDAAQAGRAIRILFGQAQVVIKDVMVERLEEGAVRLSGHVLRPS
jgi:hypothetical protein